MMPFYEHAAAVYEPISAVKWMELTSSVAAFLLYQLMGGCISRRVHIFRIIAGVIYCLGAVAANYMLGCKFAIHAGINIAVFLAAIYFIESPRLFKTRMLLAGNAHAASRRTIQILETYPAICASLLIVLFLWPGTFHSFDVTDGGYHLSESMMVFHNGLAKAGVANISFLSFYAAGALLSIVDYVFHIGLFGARLIWIFGIIAPVAIVIHILKRLFCTHWLLAFFGLAAIANQTVYTKALDYESMPSLFAAIFMYLGYRAFGNIQSKHHLRWSVAFGIAFLSLVLSRVSAAAIGIIGIIPLMAILLQPEHRTYLTKAIATQIIAAIIAVGLFCGALYYFGALADFFTYKNHTDLHSTASSIATTLTQIKDFFAGQSAVLLLLIALVVVLAQHVKSLWVYGFAAAAIILLASPVVYGSNGNLPYMLPTALCSLVLLFAVRMLWKTIAPAKRVYFLMLIAAALLMPWVLSFGSYSALTKLANGAWLLIPVALFLLLAAAKMEPEQQTRKNLFLLTVLLTALLIASGFRTFHRYPYGDHYDRMKMTAEFSYPELKGIYTTPGRKESFEALLKAIDAERPLKNNMLLAYNNIPMLFYVTRTQPLFDEPWPNAMALDLVKSIAKDMCANAQTTPALIVRTNVETRSGNWGNNEEGPPIVEDIIFAKTKLEILDKAIGKCKSKLIWENHDFKVFRPE